MTGDWALVNDGDFAFGSNSSGYPLISPPLVEVDAPDRDRIAQPRGDGYRSGIGYQRGMTITADVRIKRADAATALAASEPLVSAWRADNIRGVPGQLAELRAPSGRSAFGMPNRCQPVDAALHIGHRTAMLTFEADYSLWYGPEERHEVQLVPVSEGAFAVPMEVPLLLTGGSERSSAFTVGGELPTDHVVLEVLGGAILNPVVGVLGQFAIETQVLVPFDVPLVHDARPWVRTSLLGAGSVAGARTRASTRLAGVRLPPGTHHLVLGGQPIGNPRLRIHWRPAFPTY